MAATTKILWAHHTFNPWWGCAKVSPGCEHCYAERWAHRWGGKWGPQTARVIKDNWTEPLKWDRAAAKAGERRRVFALSMGDWLEDRDELVEPLARLLDIIQDTPNLDWLLLTKRPKNWRNRMELVSRFGLTNQSRPGPRKAGEIASRWLLTGDGPVNVWVLASVENQEYANRRIPHLLRIPARVHGLSCEPLLGPIDLTPWLNCCCCHEPPSHRAFHHLGASDHQYQPAIDWVIIGGETGPGARPCNTAWIQSLLHQCQEAQVPCLIKQLGSSPYASNPDPYCPAECSCGLHRGFRSSGAADPAEWPEDLRVREFPS